MFKSPTRITTFDEPEPLGAYTTATDARLGTACDDLLAQIDRMLAPEEDTRFEATRISSYPIAHEPLFGTLVHDTPAVFLAGWSDPDASWLLGHRPAVQRPDEAGEATAQLDTSMREIQSWLGIGLALVVRAVGISRGTVYAWRERNSTPRPATVAAVLRVHGLVSAAVRSVGVDVTRAWFHAGEPSPLDDMVAAQGDLVLLRKVSSRVRRELLKVPLPQPNPLLSVTVNDRAE
ncbi:hypothetical protein [Amycolatopsis saalfeldensis]|uniref:Uncharacterized protein n=1 Tax=Amycolatopsis saalfeldensis TaxID=394193 RepID=A0A1H8YPI4_9PSEU|nr:hypothetical protein [Amycolatopsis saalfeldensis]SEP54097.1 hypothetical protein SAMN04489732_13654 [Amycolatopsis saalfeldensis]